MIPVELVDDVAKDRVQNARPLAGILFVPGLTRRTTPPQLALLELSRRICHEPPVGVNRDPSNTPRAQVYAEPRHVKE